MKSSLTFLLISSLLCECFIAYPQSSFNRFLTPSDSLDKTRVCIVGTSWAVLYTGTMIGLSQVWYKDYPKTTFHFFNDNDEWLQMDKVGHTYTAYFESVWTTTALKWSGVNSKKSAWIGSATGFVFQCSIELLDGFSSGWGASTGDIAANFLGSSLSLSQYLLWNEQRIQMKFSAHPGNYPEGIQYRTNDLYGASVLERTVKDYNGQTDWLSVNPSSFLSNQKSKFPKWLNVAVGYGVDGLLGAESNSWEVHGETVASDISRVRQFYLSPDVDLTRIKTHSAFLKTFFAVANIIKIPAPTFEIDSKGDFKFYPLYF